MHGSGLRGALGPRGWFRGGRPFRARDARRASNTPHSVAGGQGAIEKGPSFRLPVKDAVTASTFAVIGDLLAQSLQRYVSEDKGGRVDLLRVAKMGGWGLLFYGPFQHYWYRFLAAQFPGKAVGNFVAKVAANQLILAPIVLTSVFSWNLAFQGKINEIPAKMKKDLWPTMVRGWAFWVPAASINFWAIPLQYQVMYMSSCGIVWSTYLSFTSYASLADLLRARAPSKTA